MPNDTMSDHICISLSLFLFLKPLIPSLSRMQMMCKIQCFFSFSYVVISLDSELCEVGRGGARQWLRTASISLKMVQDLSLYEWRTSAEIEDRRITLTAKTCFSACSYSKKRWVGEVHGNGLELHRFLWKRYRTYHFMNEEHLLKLKIVGSLWPPKRASQLVLILRRGGSGRCTAMA